MSAKPQNLCMLSTGKAVGAFPDFVATWNWLVSFISNLKGEGDDYNQSGDSELRDKIHIDKSVDDHPVIRGGGGASIETDADSNFKIIADIQYDATTHTIQKKECTVTVEDGKITAISKPGSWYSITGGSCTPVPVS